jgi:hypothetical protein
MASITARVPEIACREKPSFLSVSRTSTSLYKSLLFGRIYRIRPVIGRMFSHFVEPPDPPRQPEENLFLYPYNDQLERCEWSTAKRASFSKLLILVMAFPQMKVLQMN